MSEYSYADNTRVEYTDSGQFICPRCSHLSPSRPPVFNSDNCGCVEAAMLSNGGGRGGGQSPELLPDERQQYDIGAPSPRYHYSPASYPSSSRSEACPEGPENRGPNINVTENTDNYLTLSPQDGRNEVEHRYSSLFDANMSYQLRRFILDQEYHDLAYATPHTSPGQAGNQFLPQDPYIQSQTSLAVAKSSKKSKQSKKSKSSSRSGDMSYVGYGADPTALVGSWDVEGGGDGYHEGESYPLTMSGILG